MYCPTCREPARLPWKHAQDCQEGLNAKVRFYEAGLPIVLVLLAAETVLLVMAYLALGRCV